ncbi:hypothetical protein EJ357_47195 [Streptomyces cyaneochromogenes]|uniref:Transposase DDE domain-containing protein n=1 Tax=Streptomyces cyaneochromogenes TaxID=2496836 RepID=A0A3Q9F0M5_9ACTN|nr:hypothetical protein EJ357_47195 [Streptomyces cyaneochromogenes]
MPPGVAVPSRTVGPGDRRRLGRLRHAKNGLIPWAKKYLDITLKTVRRPPEAKGFVVLPRRWTVERGWSWIMRARRHCRDHERLPEMSESLITWRPSR